jgi:hypothetical protein
MDLDGHRVVEVIVTGRDGSSGRGSGYRVRDRLVLTAAHVVSNVVEVTARFDADQPGEWPAPATVAWCDPAVDLALLRLERVDGVQVRPVRFGRLARRAERVEAHVVGFPRWKLRRGADGGWVREACHAVGTIAGLANSRSGTLEITPSSRPRRIRIRRCRRGRRCRGLRCGSPGAWWVWCRRTTAAKGLGRLTAVRLDRLGGEAAGMLGLPDGADPLVDVLALVDEALVDEAGRAVRDVHRAEPADAIDVVLEIDDAEVRLVGTGSPVVAAAHGGVSAALADAANRLHRARAYLAGTRDADAASSGPVVQANTLVGRLLGEVFLPGPVVAALVDIVASARSRRAALRLGVQATGELSRLPWETLWLPGAAQPLCLDSVVRLYRKTPPQRRRRPVVRCGS